MSASLTRSQQSRAKRDHREGKSHCSGVDQEEGSVCFGGGWRKYREKEARRNENRSQWNSDSDCPKQ